MAGRGTPVAQAMMSSRTVAPSFTWMLILIAVFATFFELGRMDVESDNEGQRAAPPAEMLRSGDLLVPTINGQTYLNKPPLLYWAIAGVYKVSGTISPFTARIPTAVCAVLLVVLAYLYLRHRTGERAARWTALGLLASPYILQRARIAELDIPLTLAIFGAIVAYREASRAQESVRRFKLVLAAGVCLAAAIMLKGPVPFLFLAAVWMAHLIVEGDRADKAIRLGLWWTAAAVAVAVPLLAAQYFGMTVRFPIPLVLMVGAWSFAAWRYGGPTRIRHTGLMLCIMAVGVFLAAPWALAVLYREGWENIRTLLHSQVTERTYAASRINSGNPLYYVRLLPFMLAPWGLLLPLQCSREEWSQRSGLYRFSVLAGWLSVGIFSLIAGKEYEYVLPAVPFLLIAVGVHVAALLDGTLVGWRLTWARMWVTIVSATLPILAVGAAIYGVMKERHPMLLMELALLTLFVGFLWYRGKHDVAQRTATIAASSLFVILMGLLLQAFYYTGRNSPRELAELAGDLRRQGYDVEAVKVYPAFAFYAGTEIPVQVDPAKIREKLAGKVPYYYVTREEFLPQAEQLGPGVPMPEVLTKTYTKKDLLLIGNRGLPAGR